METLKSGNAPALVTNLEVFNMLEESIEQRKESAELEGLQSRQRRRIDKLQHRDWMEEKVHEYLKYSPCANLEMKKLPEFVALLKGEKNSDGKHSKYQSGDSKTENNEEEMRKGFNLTDAETLQVLNLMPKEMVEIHLIVEDLDARMNEEKQSKLLELVQTYATPPDGDGENEDMNAEEHEEADEDMEDFE
mmetsp:Transcript_2536/g.3855  ORF Transcript_2536/g.3855 Transcript_2536/m.3855 type:complete len:191 (-) Transcript_2536:410-982(-)